MARIIEQRRSLHASLKSHRDANMRLMSQMGQMQALANLGLISSMIAHEMNNILTPLGSYAELALQNPGDLAFTRKALQKTVLNSARATKILESMLAIAGGKMQPKTSHKLLPLIDEIFACLARDFSKDAIDVKIDIDPDLAVFAENICLQQVLMNFILNARDSMLPRGGSLTIVAQEIDDHSIITVTDTGCGIAAENTEKIFEPFFTTKSHAANTKQNGAGLGLAFCKRIIDEHEGTITVDSIPTKGTTFTITLPTGDNSNSC